MVNSIKMKSLLMGLILMVGFSSVPNQATQRSGFGWFKVASSGALAVVGVAAWYAYRYFTNADNRVARRAADAEQAAADAEGADAEADADAEEAAAEEVNNLDALFDATKENDIA